ncbi:MAG: dual specificity protein phosphatase family protein [Anaerolineales bacterium]|nr:dual specificity protein phosphatase family protein [Anaerolineales bacterium]
MPAKTRTRIIERPFAALLQGGRLDSYGETKHKVVLTVQGFQPLSSKLIRRDGKIIERVRAKFIPLELTFSKISKLKRDAFFVNLGEYGMDDPSRTIAYVYSWRQPNQQDIFYMFGLRPPADADMSFLARKTICNISRSPQQPFIIERDWSPAPPMTNRLVPQFKRMHEQFGGDPISVNIKGDEKSRRLFIGGVHIQPKFRPKVDAVLNLGEERSHWVKPKKALHPNDRAIEHGEGSQGMTVEQIREEAGWVIERLQNDQRVLVHCVAGMNRSVTVCCAALILLEGLNAEAALARVRQHHPWARPDSRHWLALRWLVESKRKNR